MMKSFWLNACAVFLTASLMLCFLESAATAVAEVPIPGGDCKATLYTCGAGTCTTAATDCIDPATKCNCKK